MFFRKKKLKKKKLIKKFFIKKKIKKKKISEKFPYTNFYFPDEITQIKIKFPFFFLEKSMRFCNFLKFE